MPHQQQIENWIDGYRSCLIRIVQELPSRAAEVTISYLPPAFNAYEDAFEFHPSTISRLGVVHLDEIEDIFPSSVIQQGLSVSRAKDFSQYRPCIAIEQTPCSDSENIDITRLQAVWQTVLRRHSLLCARLVEDFASIRQSIYDGKSQGSRSK
jgi:hypothetical protein